MGNVHGGLQKLGNIKSIVHLYTIGLQLLSPDALLEASLSTIMGSLPMTNAPIMPIKHAPMWKFRANNKRKVSYNIEP
jgi:hypothetical protein